MHRGGEGDEDGEDPGTDGVDGGKEGCWTDRVIGGLPGHQ
jgi:hypothetical protein